VPIAAPPRYLFLRTATAAIPISNTKLTNKYGQYVGTSGRRKKYAAKPATNTTINSTYRLRSLDMPPFYRRGGQVFTPPDPITATFVTKAVSGGRAEHAA